MSKPFPALCRDCKHSHPQERREWNLRCSNPVVNSKDHWVLGGGKSIDGTSCTLERERTSCLAACGRKGKLWEPKETPHE